MSETLHPFRYVFKLTNGETITCAPNEARRVLDKRHPLAQPETVWEIQVRGIWRTFWPEEIQGYEMDTPQRGSVLVEYALVVSVMGLTAVAALHGLGLHVADVLNTIAGEL